MTVQGSRMVVAVALGYLLIGVHGSAGAFPVDGDQTALPPKTELNEDALDKPREIFRSESGGGGKSYLVNLGNLAFSSPGILGGVARQASVSCGTCHVNGAGNAMFVRPVHWVVMLYGKELVTATLLDTPAGHLTRGHRFHAPRPIRIASPGSYERTLRERGHVLADFAARRERIRAEVAAAAANVQGRARITEALLQEVTALVEWPVALTGRFEERFLSLPREVLISTLEDHQRYFAVEDAQERLLPAFIAVSNIESRDPATVRAGNERVVRPRLADAAFFWEQDRRQPLAARRAALGCSRS